MILSRRKAHFYMVSALCVIVPIVAIAGLIWRPATPISSDADSLFTAANFSEPEKRKTITALKPLSIKNLSILARTVKRSDNQLYLELHPQEALEFSDILVYWLPAQANTDAIDTSAVLLGQLSGTSRRQFPISSTMMDQSGQLLFFSQGQQQNIAVVPFPASSSSE